MLPVGKVDPSLLRACIRWVGPVAFRRGDRAVERIGVTGASVTFTGRPRGWIRGCDASSLSRSSPRSVWCGGVVGRTRASGHLYDPRLDLGCRDRHGRSLGFAWIDPVRGARYVSVAGPAYTEIYTAAGGLPVRATTHDVSEQGASAVFRVAQYAADGKKLSSESLRTIVAG